MVTQLCELNPQHRTAVSASPVTVDALGRVRYPKQSGDIYSLRVLPPVTQTRLFGPPGGCRSHCLVRDSGTQSERCGVGSCTTSPLE